MAHATPPTAGAGFRILPLLATFAFSGTAIACAAQNPGRPVLPQPVAVRDGEVVFAGEERFHFLPPLASEPAAKGSFDPTWMPVVSVCVWRPSGCGAVVAEFTVGGTDSAALRVEPDASRYAADWRLSEDRLVPGTVYRVRVMMESRELDHADVEIVAGGRGARSVRSGQVVPLDVGGKFLVSFRIDEGYKMRPPVPPSPPDTISAWVYGGEPVSDSPALSGTFLKNVLFVVFRKGSSQADRQEAVDAVGGTVVGGKPRYGAEGVYVVLVRDDHPDVPGRALREASDLLQSLPQVEMAVPEFLLSSIGENGLTGRPSTLPDLNSLQSRDTNAWSPVPTASVAGFPESTAE